MLQQQTLSNKAAPQTGSTVVNMGYRFTRGTWAHKLYALRSGPRSPRRVSPFRGTQPALLA